jgi:hypothetical protein
MPEEIGKIGLDISDFQDGLADLAVLIPEVEQEIKQMNAQLALMELRGEQGTKAFVSLSNKIKEQGIFLAESKKQFASFNSVIGDEAPKKTKTLIQSLSALRSNIGLIFSGVALGGAVGFIKSLLSFGLQIKETSIVAGVLPENLQKIQAALAGNLSADETSSALKTLNNLLAQAKAGSVDAQQSLDRFGASAEDTADTALLKFAEYIKNTDNEVVALNVSTNTFGDDLGRKIIPAVSIGAEAIKAMGDASFVASEQMIDFSANGERALQKLSQDSKKAALSFSGTVATIWENLKLGNIKGAARMLWTGNPNPEDSMNFPVSEPDIRKTFPKTKPTTESQKPTTGETQKPSESKSKNKDLAASLALLDTETEIAKSIAPEYVKQKQLLVAQQEKLNQELESQLKIEGNV